jgi:hypothetical protein
MKKIIHHLRNKPHEERRHILHLTVFVFSVGMVFVWIYSLSTNLVSSDNASSIKKDLAPIAEFTDTLSTDYKDFTTSN